MEELMNKEVSIVIREDGSLVCLQNELTSCFSSLGSVTTRRASHVEPGNRALRLAFHVLRCMFGDKGWVASFTRYWPCHWRINLSPIGGPILPYQWNDRLAAIEAEVSWLNANLE